jgi:hypothetical protein
LFYFSNKCKKKKLTFQNPTIIYKNTGKATLISILDLFEKNPYSRIYLSSFITVDSIRKFIAYEIFKTYDRFKNEAFSSKNIIKMIQDEIY